jgi:DNA-binding beta-propeller fold protein YncE
MLKSSFKLSHKILFSVQVLALVGLVTSSVYFVLKPDFLNYAFAIPTDQVDAILSTWGLPTYSKGISNMISDFGGNMFFSDTGANKIGRLEPTTNMITEWTLPSNSSKPAGIAFDSASGNIYFADSGANKIGRLVPTTNVITEWNIGKSPLALSVTPGGSIYYIDDIGGIGRLG